MNRISPAQCDTNGDQDLGTASYTNGNEVPGEPSVLKNIGIIEKAHTEEYRDEEVSDHGEKDGAGYDMSAGAQVDRLVWEEIDGKQDEDQDMNGVEYLQ